MGLAVRPSCPLFLPSDQGSGMSVTMLSLEKILLIQGPPVTIEESPLGGRGWVQGGIS